MRFLLACSLAGLLAACPSTKAKSAQPAAPGGARSGIESNDREKRESEGATSDQQPQDEDDAGSTSPGADPCEGGE